MNVNVLSYCVIAIQKADKAKELGKMYVQVDAEVLKLLATELMNRLQTEPPMRALKTIRRECR